MKMFDSDVEQDTKAEVTANLVSVVNDAGASGTVDRTVFQQVTFTLAVNMS